MHIYTYSALLALFYINLQLSNIEQASKHPFLQALLLKTECEQTTEACVRISKFIWNRVDSNHQPLRTKQGSECSIQF